VGAALALGLEVETSPALMSWEVREELTERRVEGVQLKTQMKEED
jgi:hypothetical protein